MREVLLASLFCCQGSLFTVGATRGGLGQRSTQPDLLDMRCPICQSCFAIFKYGGAAKVLGYLDEDGISKTSTTETYAAVKLLVETRRWAGVPFYLRTGKRMGKRVSEIAARKAIWVIRIGPPTAANWDTP